MSAAEALILARATGIRVRVDGDTLVLGGAEPPPTKLLEHLARYKADILTLLLPQGNNGWSGEDWWEFFEERAGVAEFDGGLPRDQAETQAFSCCVGEWLHRNPVRSPAGLCNLCGQFKAVLFPYLTDYSVKTPGHTWLHQDCSRIWHKERQDKAISGLARIGICNRVNLNE